MNDIIFKDQNGHTISRSDLDKVTGEVNYEIGGNKAVHPKANKLHKEAMHSGKLESLMKRS